MIPELIIEQVTGDSRQVRAGALFVACKGGFTDGHDFIKQAIEKGAVVVVGERKLEDLPVPYFRVENSRQALAYLAAGFFEHPARRLSMIGITGTDGKTTTTNLVYKILKHAGISAGMVSTVNAVIGDEVIDTGFHVTTPDAPEIQQYLVRMLEKGVTHAVLETTSHGWSQFRVDACEFDIGVITNITHEHLDQHGSYKNYSAAKGRLFSSLAGSIHKSGQQIRHAILNIDDISYSYLKSITQVPITTYGIASDNSDFRAINIKSSQAGISFEVVLPEDGIIPIQSPMVGEFNVYNCLAALATAVSGLKIAPDVAAEGIRIFTGVPGRMERIYVGEEFYAYVDFAHTPNALRVALESARKMTQGKVIVVFGSAGLRDKEKRRLMAETAIELADVSIFTAEDPRTESLNRILEEMELGAISRSGVKEKDYFSIPDRGNAIRFGVKLAEKGDLVICCGKGHEQSMCFGTREYPWDDRIALKAAISEKLGIDSPAMPYLPTQDVEHD